MTNWFFVGRVVLKATLLFVTINVVYALTNPLPTVHSVSVYNTLVPGRERLPYGENPSESYNITILQVEGMFTSHILNDADKKNDEYRVFLVGDSSVWGWLLDEDETLSACLNRANLKTPDGEKIHVYNLGYPILDATKDLLLLQHGLQYEPDMVVWLVTMASLYPYEQLIHDVVRANPEKVRELIDRYNLALNPDELPGSPNFWERTLVGQRKDLAEWLRFQMYGLGWATTDIDYRSPEFFHPVQSSLYDSTMLFDGRDEQVLTRADFSFDVIAAGVDMAQEAGAEVLIVNQPMFVSSGVNSDKRYNFYYPRWAYDMYHTMIAELASENGWQYADYWDAIPNEAYTDSSFHATPEATCDFALLLGGEIQRSAP
ncbi:MAG: hypothetical protein F9K27_06070 [Anaerolineae bacterium]|nr:MAG: hypothetical protein F9K27_06070 [Anaerolineae bacterium]